MLFGLAFPIYFAINFTLSCAVRSLQNPRPRTASRRVYGSGDAQANCRVTLNSAEFGIEGCAILLEGIARQKFHL